MIIRKPSSQLLKGVECEILNAPMSDYTPMSFFGGVAHYYGDTVRQLFIVAAALLLIAAPFYADTLRSELFYEIAGAVVLVAIAALANPHNKSTFMFAAIAAGVGLVVYESWALNKYFDSTWVQFILREVIALIFLVAFYYSVKTLRAFLLHRVGKQDEVGEFEEPALSGTPAKGEKKHVDDFLPWVHRNNSNNSKKLPEESGPRVNPGRSLDETMPKSHPYEEQL